MLIYTYYIYILAIIGDWGLGIGDWGLPNPQSPIPNIYTICNISIIFYNLYNNI